MKTYEEMTREELRQEASKRGIKNYILMSNLKLIESLKAADAHKTEIAEQLGEQGVESKVSKVIKVTKFYDELAEYGASALYGKVDEIVNDRDVEDLEESELDAILTLVPQFNKADYKRAVVEKKEEKKEEKVEEKGSANEPQVAKVRPVEKKEKASRPTTGESGKGEIAAGNKWLSIVEEGLKAGKTRAAIAKEVGKSAVYISKIAQKLKAMGRIG